jgi:hypothetical protein
MSVLWSGFDKIGRAHTRTFLALTSFHELTLQSPDLHRRSLESRAQVAQLTSVYPHSRPCPSACSAA